MDKTTVVNTVRQYADAVTKEMSPASIVLYGSYAKGNAREDSDIDVAVIFDGFTGACSKHHPFFGEFAVKSASISSRFCSTARRTRAGL